MKNDYIYKKNGQKIRPFYPVIEDIDIEVISLSLSNKCRFTGLIYFYSVAEHCVRISEYFSDRKLALTALLHEIDEVYLSDYPSPIKNQIYYKINDDFVSHEVISEKYFNLCSKKFNTIFPLPEQIKYLDVVFCKAEMNQFFGKCPRDRSINNYPLLNIYFEQWDPQYAEYKFLKRFRELM